MSRLLEELERRREQAGVSKSDLAHTLGISRMSVHRKLAGEAPLTLPEAARICEAIGADLGELVAQFGHGDD